MLKKVLITLNNSKLSGIERYALLLAENINKTEFDVTIALPTQGPFCDLLESNKIKYVIFNNKLNGKYTLSGIIFLFKHIFKTKYDVIHAQAGVVPCIFGKLLGVKLVIEHKHGLDFTIEQINSFNIFSVFYQKAKKYFCDLTLTVCDRDKNILVNKFNYKIDKVITIYNGIKPIYETRKSFNSENPIKIGTVGRLTYQKAQEYFIDLAEKICKESLLCEFLIYGDGEDYNKLKNLIKEKGLGKFVKLNGYTNDVDSVLKKLDIFVLTSRYEGIPYILLEAMNNSLPIISTNVGGINEVIENNYTGLLVPEGDVLEMEKKLKLLLLDIDFRYELGKNAKNYFMKKFTLEKTIESIESIYKLDFKNPLWKN